MTRCQPQTQRCTEQPKRTCWQRKQPQTLQNDGRFCPVAETRDGFSWVCHPSLSAPSSPIVIVAKTRKELANKPEVPGPPGLSAAPHLLQPGDGRTINEPNASNRPSPEKGETRGVFCCPRGNPRALRRRAALSAESTHNQFSPGGATEDYGEQRNELPPPQMKGSSM